MNESTKNYWNERSDDYFNNVGSYDAIIKNPTRAFPAAVYPLIQAHTGELRGKKVCVPSSGDNIAAFGFHLLGARVTSCDLSENQITNAKLIAGMHGWDIEFVCCDTMNPDVLKSDFYDLVYTSNGVHVWISDLHSMYKNIHRILKPGGYDIFFETHPMIRPFDNTTYDIKIKKLYEDIGSFVAEHPTYDWRTQDFINAIAAAGFTIKEMREFHSLREDLNDHNYLHIREDDRSRFNWPGDTFDWKNNPWAALPQCISICSQRVD